MSSAWPVTAGDLTTGWLSGALGESVRSVEIVERHEMTNAHARLLVTFEDGRTQPVFAKLPPLDPGRRDAIIATMMGRREALFYAELAPVLAMRVPESYAALSDESGMFVVLLEDLEHTGCAVSDGTWGVPPDAAAGALADLAAMHARFEDPAGRRAAAPWAAVSRPSNAYGAPMLRHGIEHHRERLTDSFVAIAELYCERHDELQELWHRGPHTLIHGDTHIGNLFLDGGRVGFLDWGIVNVNTPMRDVSYFLTMAMQVDDRRTHERDLLREYLAVRASLGGSPISFDEAWTAHRWHAAYNVPASCQVVTFPADASPRRQVFADAFLARAQASLDDLEAVAALREAGIS